MFNHIEKNQGIGLWLANLSSILFRVFPVSKLEEMALLTKMDIIAFSKQMRQWCDPQPLAQTVYIPEVSLEDFHHANERKIHN